MERQDLTRLKIDHDRKAVTGLPRRYRQYMFSLALLVGVTVIGYLFYGQTLGAALPVEVGTVTTIYPSQAFTLLNATGYVVPQVKADVASKATGRLESLTVTEGSYVKKGQIIARLEDQDVIANLEQAGANLQVAQANLKQAEAELKDATLALNRSQDLIKRKFVTQESYDSAVSRYNKAAAAVDSAKASIAAANAAYNSAKVAVEYTLIRAPFDGMILTKQANLGDIVAPFSSAVESKGAVVTMADLSTLEVETDVAESKLQKVQPDQPCEIQLDAVPDIRFRCAVSRIVPTVDKTKATVLVKVRLLDKDPRILPNMSAKVAFLSQELSLEQQKPVTAVQSAAVVTHAGRQVVFRVRADRVSIVPVEAGAKLGELMIVTKGLSAGDQLVLHPSEDLRDGAPIRISRS